MTDSTILRKCGIQKRMHCNGRTATRIEDAFVTVERLVDAVVSDTDLTEYDGIGPTTADVIGNWWDDRFEREEVMENSSFERTGAKTATVYFYQSWEDTIGTDNGVNQHD